MDRYSKIDTILPREFVLLQGKGCRWSRCTFCNYHEDISDNPFAVNREILQRVTGVHRVLDVINSGSAMELDDETISLLSAKKILRLCGSRLTICIAINWLNSRNYLLLQR